MYCMKCGKELPDGINFCYNCGSPTAIPQAFQPAAPEAQPEKASQEQQPQIQKYMQPQRSESYKAPSFDFNPNPSSNKRKGLLIAALAVVLFAVFVLVALFTSGDDEGETTTSADAQISVSDSTADAQISVSDSTAEDKPSSTTTTTASNTTTTTTTKTTTTKKTTTTTTTKKTTTTTKKAETMGQRNAVRKANDYLAFTAFSKSGLVEQLEFEGFSNADATYAVSHISVNWNEQAAKKAKNYIEMMSFSRDGLIEQLEFEGFTHEQAVYGAKAVGY